MKRCAEAGFEKKIAYDNSLIRLLPSEPKLGPNCRDSLVVQDLTRASEDNRLLDNDMIGIKLLEPLGLRFQLNCVS